MGKWDFPTTEVNNADENIKRGNIQTNNAKKAKSYY